jgi:hypothetical protein
VSGSFTTSGSITATGTITAQTLVVQTITSSVDFVTGSTRFGSSGSNTHVFTGSLYQTGSIAAFAGNVGIGTTTIQSGYALDVSGLGIFRGGLTLTGSGGMYLGIRSTGSDAAVLFQDTVNTGYVGLNVGSNPNKFVIYYAADTRMAIDTSGRVGFGTTSPGYNLEISSGSSSPTELAVVNTNAAGAARLSLRNAERDFIVTSNTADDLLSFAYGGSNRLQFNTTNQWFNSGNVGVGTTAPNMALDVSGSGLGGGIRSMGASGASGGKGVEIGYEIGDFGTVLAYDRTGGVFKQLRINDLIHVGTGSTGNVGIGYTGPTVKLQVSGTIAAGSNTTGWGRFSYDATTNQVRIQASKDGTDSVSLSFYTQASGGGFAERMVISGSFVGIGTSDPGQTLEVRSANGQGIRFKNSGSSDKRWDIVGSGNDLRVNETGVGAVMTFEAGGNIGIGTTDPDSRLSSTSASPGPYGTGTPDIAIGGNIGGSTTALQIYRTAATGGNIGIDAFRAGVSSGFLLLNAANGGRVGIGTTNPDAGLQIAQPGQDDQLTIGSLSNNRDHAVFMCSGTNKAEILRYQSGVRLIFGSSGNISNVDVIPGGTNGVRLSAGNTSWSAFTSDERKKKNFETVPGLEAVMQINPVKYHFKTQEDSETKKLGFIAQNIQPLIPEMVHANGEKAEDETDILTIIPDYMLPVLVKAIQELNTKLDAANAEIEALKLK